MQTLCGGVQHSTCKLLSAFNTKSFKLDPIANDDRVMDRNVALQAWCIAC